MYFCSKLKPNNILTEKHIVLEDIDPVMLYGAGNGHLQVIKSLYPKLRIIARGNVVKVLGDEEQMAQFEENLETMRKHVLRYNSISDEDIVDIVKGQKTKEEAVKGVVVYSLTGRPIKGRSENQQRLIDEFRRIGRMHHKDCVPIIVKEWPRISRVYFQILPIKITEQWE